MTEPAQPPNLSIQEWRAVLLTIRDRARRDRDSMLADGWPMPEYQPPDTPMPDLVDDEQVHGQAYYAASVWSAVAAGWFDWPDEDWLPG